MYNVVMVKENRIVFGPSDICKIRLICGECQLEVAYPVPQASSQLTEKCPHCEKRWKIGTGRLARAYQELSSLARAMSFLANPSNGVPFSVQFEMDGAESKDS